MTSLLGTDWYVRQIIRRPIHEYDAARGPAIYRDSTWRKPTAPPLHMTIDEADSVPSYVLLKGPQSFRKDSIAVTITGQRDAGVPGPFLTRDQILVLRFSSMGDIVLTTPALRCIKEQVPGAEVHFASRQKCNGSEDPPAG